MRAALSRGARIWRTASTACVTVLLLVAIAAMVKLFDGASGSIVDLVNGNIPPPPLPASASWPAGTELSQLLAPQPGGAAPAEAAIGLRVDASHSLATVDPEYLSFSLDSAQVVGARWWDPQGTKIETNSGSIVSEPFDFYQPGLDLLTQALSPALLRIGGSEADRLWYDMDGNGTIPAGFGASLTRRQWDAANEFALRNGLRIIFTVNAGPGPRQGGQWKADNAQKLLEYSTQRHYPVKVWEFGNELNGFWFIHGLNSIVDPANYAQDLSQFSTLVHAIAPGAQVAGQGSAFWPLVGEPFSAKAGFTSAYLSRLPPDPSGRPDIVGWHYYPQQSRRSPVATRRAAPGRLLEPAALDESAHWSAQVSRAKERFLPQAEQWLSETGNAQFGGEPGVSDTWIGSLWWMDQLGLMARLGNKVMVRQTLVGLDYGLLDHETLRPRPDYWGSLLWKNLMGTQVYAIQATPNPDGKLRVYAHGAGQRAPLGSRYGALLVNLDTENSRLIALPADRAWLWLLNAPAIAGKEVLLNGNKLDIGTDPAHPVMPALTPVLAKQAFLLRPLSAVFLAW